MLLSIGRNENNLPWNGFDPCDILKYGAGAALPAVWRSCAQLGLDSKLDNLDALDLGAGDEGEPIRFAPEPPPYPYPEPEPPPEPDPPPEPEPPPEPPPA